MSVQQFCLRWNNHQPNFISVCSSLLHNGTLVDVTLAAEGKQLQAHKIVLSACSSYFQALFTSNPCQHPIVILKDVQYDDLKTMVDFMYYGEVNVSQEQLPHILKTAEMLKIKGLAEMPTDPSNLTKSESKTSNETTEVIGSANSTNQGNTCGAGGSSGGICSNTSGSVSDSIWGSTESQFQQQHHHHHQQQQHHHHQQQQHHQHQQSNQTQTSQHGLLRRTPSPLGMGASPVTRRKRLRKSSNNGSVERSNSEDQHNSSLDAANSAGGVSLSQMCQMTFSTNPGQLSGIGSHPLPTTKLLKESTSGELDAPQDSDSLDEGHAHVPMQIKPEVDISGVQSIPLDISGTTTPSEHDAPNSQSTHSEAEVLSTDKLESSLSSLSTTKNLQAPSLQLQHPETPIAIRRNRILTRQPRVKRDSDSLSTAHISPEISIAIEGHAADTKPSTGYELDIIGSSSETHRNHHLLSVPQRIGRHSSEPAPSSTTSSPHLLCIPQSTPFLTKQLSDPLLPSQQAALSTSVSTGNHFASLHRQYSHPLPGSHITSAPLNHPHHISLSESIYTSGSPSTSSSTQYYVPQQPPRTSPSSPIVFDKNCSDLTAEITTSNTTLKNISRLPQLTTTFVSIQSSSPPFSTSDSDRQSSVSVSDRSSINTKLTTSKSIPGLLPERMGGHPHVVAGTSGQVLVSSSFEHLPTLRVKTEELQRSVSSPQTTREIITLENPRSSHCPVIRPGPALGCNFCWNTIDGHGRILRRKTKYHCPECQTNLCIVPCFQEYHERLNNETFTASNTSNEHISIKQPLSTSANINIGSTATNNSSRPQNTTESV